MSLLFGGTGGLQVRAQPPGSIRTPSPFETVRFPAGPEVTGFSVEAEPVVAGLPGGVMVPAGVLDLAVAVRRLEVWLEEGARVQGWALEQGAGEEVWVDDADRLALPAALASTEVPAFVTRWVSAADEVEGLLDALSGT